MKNAMTKMMQGGLLAATVAGMAVLPGAALAKQAGDWLIRARGIAVVPDESSKITPIGGKAQVDTAIMPELDFSYFFTDNIAAELILATTNHNVKAVGTSIGDVPLGDVWLLPPTLTLQYHFMPKQMVSPYIGAGVNLTLFYSASKGPVVADISYDTAVGVALQAGVDIKIGERTSLNLDLKKIFLNTDVTIDAGALGMVDAKVDIDPWIFGIGVGMTF
jgi:outer membrane protein